MSGLIPTAMLDGVPTGFEVLNSGVFAKEQTDYLHRTPSATGNRRKWSFSAWVKITNIGDYKVLHGVEGNDGIRWQNDDTVTVIVSAGFYFNTAVVFRDVSEWYHIVVNYDSANETAADRCKVWMNNVLQVNNTGSLTLNLDSDFGVSSLIHTVGAGYNNSNTLHHDGYMAETYFINDQLLDPSNFAEEDSVTGQWNPIEYVGTYGTNGFYLDFQDGADLGKDTSGNANNFTNVGVTQSTDTPTDNHCTMNVLKYPSGAAIEDAGLNVVVNGAVNGTTFATMAVNSGKWYWEVLVNITTTATIIGVAKPENLTTLFLVEAGAYSYYGLTGDKYIDGAVAAAYGATYGATDIIGVELDMDSGTLEFFKNGTSQGVATSALSGLTLQPGVADGSGATAIDVTLGFTEDSWTHTPTSGFVALSSKNLPVPDISLPEEYFKPIIYDDGVGAKTVGFQPDLVWLKSRGSAFSHKLVDSIRGATLALSSDSTATEVTESTGLTSFDTNGFTVGADTDYSDTTGVGMVAWSWKEGVTPGFDIVSYTGDGLAGRTFAHSLGVVPEAIFIKGTSFVQNWIVGQKDMDSTAPWDYAMFLDLADTKTNNVLYWNDTAPSSTVVTVGSGNEVNSNTEDYIAYIFASIEGFSRFGHYTGNASSDGPFAHCGFRPAFIMIKSTAATAWNMIDSTRSPYNEADIILAADNTTVESNFGTTNRNVDLLSSGFKIRSTVAGGTADLNTSGGRYIFFAFAQSPFQYSRAR